MRNLITGGRNCPRPGLAIFLGIALLAGSGLGFVQSDEVVKIESMLSRDGYHPGETVTLGIVAEISSGWHIHDPGPSDMFLIPTEIVMEPSNDFEVREMAFPPTIREKYEYSESELAVYLGTVIFGVLIEPKDGLTEGDYLVKGVFNYQACDLSSCLPPESLEFEARIRLVAESVETRALYPEIFEKIRFEKKAADGPEAKNRNRP